VDRFEYVVGLFSIIVGLALADLGSSLHRLINDRSKVRWDPLAILTVAYVVLLLLAMWYDLWSIRSFEGTTSFLFLLTLLGELFVLFLLAAGSLPDEPHEGADLFAFYESHQTRLWTLLLIFQTAFAAHWFYFLVLLDISPWTRIHQVAVPIIGALVLLFVRKRWVQIPVLVCLLAFKGADYVATSL
jgi:hypothetical protein